MIELDDAAAGTRISWIARDDMPADGGCPGGTGFDPAEGWAASVWVLNAIYENPELSDAITHHELHHRAIELGLREPTMVGEMNLDENTITTGHSLGFAERPGAPWRRVRWAGLGRRDGFGFWAVSGRWPDLHYTPQEHWDDPVTIPAASWPRIDTVGQSSWPANMLPPAEGALDEQSLQALTTVLGEYTADDAITQCDFYFGCPPFMREGPKIFTGHLEELRSLVNEVDFTPSNFWPANRSWFVYTDYDLWATRVSGSPDLIDALMKSEDLDTVRCGR
ncbi:hypothetical protein BKG76_00080 [Mycobacteroides franklinii]|uniref:Uncharacterized protein n=1 Tax=Mycobacteroides franklinii TaxID=948102 RepID=A0A1S1LGN4_9MYCO|nr:hypothetical protein [Mycobacteroides franklinii]OHU31655.1 hypothetical protein BKG76_00080 [Mycobacteroides franklinii]